MYRDREPFRYSIRGFNHLIEGSNGYNTRLTQIAWVGDNEDVTPDNIHLDIRKFSIGPNGEIPRKGVSFTTKEGPANLINALIEEGYGDTASIIKLLKARPDYPQETKVQSAEKPKKEPIVEAVDINFGSTDEFKLSITEEELAKGQCNHCYPNGTTALKGPDLDGTCTCAICGTKFKATEFNSEEVKNATQNILDILNMIKMMRPSAINPYSATEYFQIIPFISKIPGFYDIAVKTRSDNLQDTQIHQKSEKPVVTSIGVPMDEFELSCNMNADEIQNIINDIGIKGTIHITISSIKEEK